MAICACSDSGGPTGQTDTSEPTVTLSKQAGDAQTAAPGTAVAVAPAVLVVDSLGTPRSGIAVTFTVMAGGGSVTGANVVSDANGIARVGSWTLGAASGINALNAAAATGAPVTFRATGERSSSDVKVALWMPDTAFVGDTVLVRAIITSTYQLASVTASMSGRSTPLAATQAGTWDGTLVLTGTPRDTATLVVRATDINGAASELVRVLTHDRPPRVILSTPLDNAVATPKLAVDAACDDDDPSGCTLTVLRAGVPLSGPSPSPLKTSVDLGALGLEGGTTITIRATDSRGQITETRGDVWIEPSTHLQLLGAGDGVAIDVGDTRLLLARYGIAYIRHLDTGTTDSIPTSGVLTTGFLTPNGAALGTSPTLVYRFRTLYVLRDGVLTQVAARSAESLDASGDYIIYSGVVGNETINYTSLYRLNVRTGVEDLVDDDAGRVPQDVADNGDVVFNDPNGIGWYRSGVSTRVTNATQTASSVDEDPSTDGTNVVFRRQGYDGATAAITSELWLSDGSSSSLLSTLNGTASRRDYAVNGGWTAFTKADASLVLQVWTRSPTGVLRAASAFGSSSGIDAIAPDGSVVFTNVNGRYLATPSGTVTRIGSRNGVARWRDGRFVVLLGNSAFAVVP